MRDEDEEQPLDPAVERVRRKLKRFVAINLGILFAALMAVVVALVYKGVSASPQSAEGPIRLPEGSGVLLPQGASILSHSLSGDRLSVHVERSDGGQSILIYNLGQGRIEAMVPVGFQ